MFFDRRNISEAAFFSLYLNHEGTFKSYAKELTNSDSHKADELLVLAKYNGLRGFDYKVSPNAFVSYMKTVIRNTFLNSLRASENYILESDVPVKEKDGEKISFNIDNAASACNTEEAVIAKDAVNRIAQHIVEHNPSAIPAVIGKLEDYTDEEIAIAAGTNKNTVKSQLKRVRDGVNKDYNPAA